MKIIKLNISEPGWPLANPNFSYLRQTPKYSGVWGDYQFVVNSPIQQCDYWVVFEHLDKTESCFCPPENTIFITGEPPSLQHYQQIFLDQFSHIISCIKEIDHKHLYLYVQGHPWFVNKNFDELSNIQEFKKNKKMSLITSNKTFTDGHKKRYQFSLKLKEYYKDQIDLFGNGIASFSDKWDVLSPYRYSIVIENFKHNDWMTEKLFDCYLAECFPFYYGCNNISSYYDKNSFVEIDIEDFDDCIEKIDRVINNPDHYPEHHRYILDSKERTLMQYNLFPNIIRFIEKNNLSPSQQKEWITIKSNDKNLKFTPWNFFKKIKNVPFLLKIRGEGR